MTVSRVYASPAISSTFIQLDQEKCSLAKSDWIRTFRTLHDLGINEIVLQWTATNQSPFFKPYEKADANVTIVDFLDLAQENSIKLKIGLLHDPEFWIRIKEKPKSLKVYFVRLTHDSLQLAKELFQEVHTHPAFSGWYLPQEIDDVHWIKPKRQKVLCLFLKEITSRLKEISPKARITISAFSTCKLSPLGMARLWEKIFSTSRIDSIYFQDGIGTRKQNFCTLPLYLEEMDDLAREHSVSFVPVVEIFELPSGNGNMHLLPPRSFGKVIKQINLASKYSAKISSFGLLECILSKPWCLKELLDQRKGSREYKKLMK